MSDFCHISLCNVIYKIIVNILANRLKCVLLAIISKTQSAFVPGCQILDNATLAFEAIHFMKGLSKRKSGFCALKLEMSKAYDRVEWGFLDCVMSKMGFSDIWRRWIMDCVSSVSFAVLINGALSSSFVLQRGLRQRDPLSPHLFLICSEGLNAMLSEACDWNDIKGIAVARGLQTTACSSLNVMFVRH